MKNRQKVPEKIRRDFELPKTALHRIIKDFHTDMERGLCGKASSLKMIPTYVDRPTGREKGSFIALDLGGTNFRVLGIELKGNGSSSEPEVMKFGLQKRYMTGKGEELFAFLASSVKKFLSKTGMGARGRIDLGFTFSFPVKQAGIASGTLVTWTKGFEASGVVGKDVVGLLRDAICKEGIGNINIAALANDTVGTLASRSYEDPYCDVGVIIGTGTNACYPEKMPLIKKWKGPSTRSGQMIINIEWGNFNKLETTVYDRQLDGESDNPRSQMLEKMVSGMYLGRLCGLVLKDLAARKHIFAGKYAGIKDKFDSFKSEHVSAVESDRSKDLKGVMKLLDELGIRGSSPADRAAVKAACAAVSTRAARISAAAIAAVITKMDPELSARHTVAVDGSVYEKHPGFAGNIKASLAGLFGRRASSIDLVLYKDGSGKGAAIIAAVASSGEGGKSSL